MFGISSAPEIYQHLIQQVLSGCDGAANISDDIIIHGKSQVEHDERLIRVLQRLDERGLTLNPSKCEFDLSHVKFMGHIISKDGLSPADDKVTAINNARPPETATEARSLSISVP